MILLLILLVMLIAILPAVLTNAPSYKYYKESYNNLPNLKWRYYAGYVTGVDKDFTGHGFCVEEFIWFTESNSVKINRYEYIHNAFYTSLDPYANYWRRKFIKWLKKNIEIEKLETGFWGM